MARQLEVEWQFTVRDLDAFRRWLVGAELDGWSVMPVAVAHLRDTYLDTTDWRVWRDGYALRLRRSGSSVEATLKARVRARRGVAVRRELITRMPDARAASILEGRGLVSARVRRLIGGRPLRRLFGVRTRRETFAIRSDGRVVAELALDRTRIAARGRERRLARVEIEVKAGRPAQVAELAATIRRRRHLTIARRSKFEEGLAAARLGPPRRR